MIWFRGKVILKTLGKTVEKVIAEFSKSTGKKNDLWFELEKFLVWKSGYLLAFHNAGAYGFEMSSNFNSRLKPAEVLFLDGKALLIRKRDEFDDLLRNQIEVI